jgi:non-specific serine/threonine protein kinase
VQANHRGGAPKLELLLETPEILRLENHKALVFSQFVAMLRLVRHELDGRGLKYVYLDGWTTDRQARVDAFQNVLTYPFFLISLKAGRG